MPTISCIRIEPVNGEPNYEEDLDTKRGAAGSGCRLWCFGAEQHVGKSTRLAAGVDSAKERSDHLKPKQPHFAPKAKNVIFIYIGGGPSTIDMWDRKPGLLKYDGKPAPFEIKGRALNGSQQILASPWPFARSPKTGRMVSDLLPHFQKVVDRPTFVRSMETIGSITRPHSSRLSPAEDLPAFRP